MVGVRCIVVGRQDRREQVAATIADRAQEGALVPLAGPIAKHADPAAVGEAETRDVDRIGSGMLAIGPSWRP